MSRWSGACRIACVCGLAAGVSAGAEGSREWLWVHQEHVAPANAAAYEDATRQFLESVGTTQDLRIRALAGPAGIYTFLSTITDGSGAEPEVGRSILERIRGEKTKGLAARGILDAVDDVGWLLVESPELSYVPGGAPWAGDGLGHFRLTFLHAAPGKGKAAASALRRLAALYEKQGLATPLRLFRLERAEGPPVWVRGDAAASRDALAAQSQEVERRLGARGRDLYRQLQASLERREVVEGMSRSDLSYPLPDKVAPLEPFAPKPPAAPAADTVEEPLPPLPLPPEPPAPPAAGVPDFAAVETTVEAWAAAWSEKRADEYLAFYASSFQTGTVSRSEWERQRRSRIAAPAFIEVGVEELSVDIVGPRTAWAEFTQFYTSDVYSDVVRKRLELEWEDGGWKIVREEALANE